MLTGLPEAAWIASAPLSTAGLMAMSAFIGFYARSVLLNLRHDNESDSPDGSAILDLPDLYSSSLRSETTAEIESATGQTSGGVARNGLNNRDSKVAEKPRTDDADSVQAQASSNTSPEEMWAAAWQAFDAPSRVALRQTDSVPTLPLHDRLLGRSPQRASKSLR